jgi:hypothetical protein
MAADITSWLGHDVVRVRYAWSGSGKGQPEREPLADGGERVSDAKQGAGGPGFTIPAQPAASAAPPTPARAARYVDPAKTAVATWRATAALSPSSQTAVSRDADGQGGTAARPESGSADMPGASDLYAYAHHDPLNAADPLGY